MWKPGVSCSKISAVPGRGMWQGAMQKKSGNVAFSSSSFKLPCGLSKSFQLSGLEAVSGQLMGLKQAWTSGLELILCLCPIARWSSKIQTPPLLQNPAESLLFFFFFGDNDMVIGRKSLLLRDDHPSIYEVSQYLQLTLKQF